MSTASMPAGWVMLPLSDVIQTQKGKKPEQLGVRSVGRKIPYINIAAFEGKPIQEYAPEQSIAKCEPSDTLLVWDGARAGLSGRGVSGYIGSTLARVTSDITDPGYLFYFINSQYGVLNTQTKGVGIPHIDPVILNSLEFGLPPAAEQTRIVAKLEELLSDLDAGVAELKAAQKKLGQYRQSLLKAAVEGALTAEWRKNSVRPEPVGGSSAANASTSSARTDATESGAALLARILTERRSRWETRQLAKFQAQGKPPPKGWQAKYPAPVAPDTVGLPVLPVGWVWSSLGQCFHVAVGATPSRKASGYWGGGIPWVSSGEVRFNRITESKEMITEDGLNNSSTRLNPVGSVLLGMIGEGKTRGQVAILDIEAANNQNCAAIWASETSVPPEYVYYWLWSRYDETRRGSSGNNQPALNKSIVENIPFPLPPLDELLQVVPLLNAALLQTSEQEAAVEYSLKQSAAQRKNILQAAFSGQLVPQDPADEPASALLARIRAERQEQASLRKPKKPNANSRRSSAC